MFYCLWNSNWKHCITHKRFKVQNRPHPNQHFEIHVVLYDQININWTTLSQKFGVASWHSNSGPNQENHKIRIMHVPTLLSQAHKTWPIKCCSQNVIKRKLWRPALCCENLMSYIINSLMLWQPCAARIKNLMSLETALCCGSLVMQKRKHLLSFSNGPCFTVIVMLRIESASAFSTTQQQHNSLAKECVTRQKAKRGPGNYSRLDNNQSRGASLKDNTQTKLRSDSANVTFDAIILYMLATPANQIILYK